MNDVLLNRGPIEWGDVHARLLKSEHSLNEALSEGLERTRAVFRRRALQLAREDSGGQSLSPGIPVLICLAGHEKYAIALDQLAEVVPFQGCTPVPGSAAEFLGLINVRGEIRAVIDLASVLSGNSSPASGVLLILRKHVSPNGPAALKIDQVEELRELRAEQLTAPVGGAFLRPLISGSLALLDIEVMMARLFSPKELHSQ